MAATLLLVAVAMTLALAACHHESTSPQGQTLGETPASGEVVWTAPDPDAIAGTADGPTILRGQEIFAHTTTASSYVGNQMNCANCHLKNGAQAWSAPLVGVTHRYPSFSKRAGHTIDLPTRIQECMVRSENGKPLPEDGPEMKGLVAYMTWLSKSAPSGHLHGTGLIPVDAPAKIDVSDGASIYANICANCHGQDGAGHPPAYPPLWGPNSFNSGAGMAQTPKMARFVLKNMPLDQPGTLTVQQAFDVAAFIDSHPRPAMNPAYKQF
jgi:thiosulfate dehydrogenase